MKPKRKQVVDCPQYQNNAEYSIVSIVTSFSLVLKRLE